MSGRIEHNTASYTINREQVILSLRKSLEPLLSRLSQEEDDSSSNPQDTLELDESIEGFLTFVGSKFSLWIFDSFLDSESVQTELWVSFFYPVVNRYRTEIVGRYKDDYSEKPVAASRASKRYDKICRHVGHFYKQFVTRVIENFGFTPQLHYVMSILHLVPSRASSTPPANEKMAPTIHLSVHDSLCHLGDLSRYRTSNGRVPAQMDYSNAAVYYTTAFKIQPTSGMPLNQLGNISYSTGDIFSGTYYFLRSVAVDEPFRDGSSNLRIILKKLLKIKDSSLTKLAIAGINHTEENEDESESDVLDDSDDNVNTGSRKDQESIVEVKETLMRLLQLYSNYYMSHLPNSKKQDSELSEALQIELTDKIYELVKARLIPSKILVKLVIMSITFVWLLEQANDKNPSKSLTDAYQSCVALTLRLIDKMLSVALFHASQGEVETLSLGERVMPVIRTLLPVFRVSLDWINKQAKDMRIVEWGQSNAQCNALFFKVTQLLEYLRKSYGFQFDIETAVARSNWDRFDDVLKQQEEFTTTETDDSGSWKNKSVSTFSRHRGRSRSLYENDEETQCSGLLPVHGGLNDTPSGLAVTKRVQKAAQEIYRAQCLLFTGIDISRISSTFLEVDEFAGENAEFVFVEMDLEDFQEQLEEDSSVVEVSAPNTLGYIHDTELYDLISRETIPKELQSEANKHRNKMAQLYSMPNGPSATSADHSKRALEMEKMHALFIGSPAQSLNSASPQFLRKLRAIEHNGHRSSQGARRGRAPRGGKKKGEPRNGAGPSEEPNRNGRGGRYRRDDAQQQPSGNARTGQVQRPPKVQAPPPAHEQFEEVDDGEDSSADESSDEEEIVFLGRTRAAG